VLEVEEFREEAKQLEGVIDETVAERLDTIIDREPQCPDCFNAEEDVCGLLEPELEASDWAGGVFRSCEALETVSSTSSQASSVCQTTEKSAGLGSAHAIQPMTTIDPKRVPAACPLVTAHAYAPTGSSIASGAIDAPRNRQLEHSAGIDFISTDAHDPETSVWKPPVRHGPAGARANTVRHRTARRSTWSSSWTSTPPTTERRRPSPARTAVAIIGVRFRRDLIGLPPE